MNKHLVWAIALTLITAMVCGTLIYLNHNSWTVRFEMDDNTKEAIQSIEYPILNVEDYSESRIISEVDNETS